MQKHLNLTWILFALIILTSLFFRIKIINELPLGTTANSYGLTGFDDEPAHLNYTKFILSNNHLPILKNRITEPNALEINEFEYHQPPLYYLTVATIAKTFSITDEHNILLVGRYFNFILSFFSIIIFYLIFQQFNWNKLKIFSAISIYLLLGSSVYQYSVFGNDGLSWFLLWLLFLLVLKGVSKNWIGIIILLALSHYTKSSVLVYYPILLFASYNELMKRSYSKETILKLSLVFIAPLILAFPWYLRNYYVYGSFFSLSTITGESWYFVKSLEESIIKLFHMPYLFLFRMHFNPPKPLLHWFNLLPDVLLIVAALGWISDFKRIYTSSYFIQLINLLLISMIGAYLYYALPTGYTEGRLLYPGLPAILYFMTKPLFTKTTENLFFEGWQLLFIIITFLPSYIIGFYF